MVLAAGLATLGQAPAALATADKPSVLTVAIQLDPKTLNPFTAENSTAIQILRLSYDYLTDYRPSDNEAVPGLAEKWSVAADKLTWTFTIRKNATWSDGKPVTARDIAFTYNVILTGSGAKSVNSALLKTFDTVKATDDRTLVIRTKVPTATMFGLDVPIVPEHVWSKIPDVQSPALKVPQVGSGTFRIAEVRDGELWRLRANPRHWAHPPKVDELLFRLFSTSESAVLALQKGEVDMASTLTPAQFSALSRDTRVARVEAGGLRLHELVLNPGARTAAGVPFGDGHPALRDQRVRAAIEQAIDRKTLAAKVLGGHGLAGGAYLPPRGAPWDWQPDAATAHAFDLAKANQLLDAAGYRRGADGIRTMPGNGQPLKLRLYAPTSRTAFFDYTAYIREWLHSAGIEVTNSAVQDDRLGDLQDAGNFDMLVGGWGVDPDPDYLLSIHTCGVLPTAPGGPADTDAFRCDPKFDELYNKQAAETDPAKRPAIIHQMLDILYRDATAITLTYPTSLEVYRKDKFRGFTTRPGPTGSVMGYWSYRTAEPVAGAASADKPSRTPLAIGGGVAALLIAGAAGLYLRRRATRHLRE